MTVTFPFTPEIMKMGAREFHRHRHHSHLNIVVLAIAAALFTLNFLLDANTGMKTSTALLFGAAIWMQWGTHRSIREIVNNAFEGKPQTRDITLSINDDFLGYTNGESQGKMSWEAFVDCKICDGGLLLYPQKNFFHWIPDTAEIQGGTWEEFTKLVSSKVSARSPHL